MPNRNNNFAICYKFFLPIFNYKKKKGWSTTKAMNCQHETRKVVKKGEENMLEENMLRMKR